MVSIKESMVVGQSVKQVARRRAMEAQAKMRKARANAERRRSALAVDIVVALTERDAAIERHERVAADAVARLIDGEGLSVAEVGTWADGLSVAEVKRLRKLAGRAERTTV